MKRKILVTLLSAAAIFAAGALTACSNAGGPCTHKWDDGDITSPASCGSIGLISYICTECGELKTEVLPQLEHEHSEEWLKNADEHWHPATCRHTDARVGVAPHEWGDGEVITAATCLKAGLRKYTCICGETKTEAIEKTGHAFPETFNKDDDKHRRVCTNEGCNEITDEGEHSFGEWSTEGRLYRACTECGYEELAPALTTGAGYNTATVTVGGGEKCAVNVFALGYYYYTVTYSGETSVKVVCEYVDNKGNNVSNQYVLSPQNTSFTERLPERSIACLFIESDAETAFGCQLSLSVSETAPKHTHNYSDEWSYDADQHWHACTGSGCDVDADVGMHEFADGVCSTCGYENKETQE